MVILCRLSPPAWPLYTPSMAKGQSVLLAFTGAWLLTKQLYHETLPCALVIQSQRYLLCTGPAPPPDTDTTARPSYSGLPASFPPFPPAKPQALALCFPHSPSPCLSPSYWEAPRHPVTGCWSTVSPVPHPPTSSAPRALATFLCHLPPSQTLPSLLPSLRRRGPLPSPFLH